MLGFAFERGVRSHGRFVLTESLVRVVLFVAWGVSLWQWWSMWTVVAGAAGLVAFSFVMARFEARYSGFIPDDMAGTVRRLRWWNMALAASIAVLLAAALIFVPEMRAVTEGSSGWPAALIAGCGIASVLPRLAYGELLLRN